MNTFELRSVEDPNQLFDGFGYAQILIDRVDLITRVQAVEAPSALKAGTPSIAGSYGYLGCSQTFYPCRRFLGGSDATAEPGRPTVILVCECGVSGCWDLFCSIVMTDETVIWSNFVQARRDWDYKGLGPFVFDRRAYERELGCPAQP